MKRRHEAPLLDFLTRGVRCAPGSCISVPETIGLVHSLPVMGQLLDGHQL